jgi:hypothetical protein
MQKFGPSLMLCLGSACTTLGPMPALTGTTPLPPDRAGVELQVGLIPGYFLSETVQADEDREGKAIAQGALLGELGRLIGLPGFALGGRYVGSHDEGGYLEPMLGYRTFFDGARRFAGALVAHGTHASGDRHGASYSMTRGGLEAALDVRLTPEHRWVELHALGIVSAVALSANGTYCLDEDGRYGITCPEEPPRNVTDVSGSGLYPAASLGLAVDGGRHLDGPFHGARLAGYLAAGAMPTVEAGRQRDAEPYAMVGLSLTVGLGASE